MDKKKIGLLVVIIILVVFSIFTIKWIVHRINYVITDAVFVETEYLSNIGFNRVSGKIIQLYKKEGDSVKAEEILAKLDDTDYKIQIESLDYQIKSLEAQKLELEKKIERIKQETEINENINILTTQEISKKIESLEAKKSEIEVHIKKVAKDEERYKNLYNKGLVAKSKYEEIETQLDVLIKEKESISKDIAQLKISYEKSKENVKYVRVQRRIVDELLEKYASLEEQINVLKKNREDLENILNYTYLKSPFNGIVAKKYVSLGDIVKAGQPVYALVKSDSFYIKVLLEETKLEGVKEGSKAYIRLDAYPDKVFEGVVENIDIASAAKFALVPRDISAGEFTKLAQRIPVKIKITKGNTSLLRVGLGGKVEIKKTR